MFFYLIIKPKSFEMKFYYVYILLCKDKSLYVELASNLERRRRT
jgi:predicted GIY-YIG superfamily endonuclease